jgi:hypothetical protein
MSYKCSTGKCVFEAFVTPEKDVIEKCIKCGTSYLHKFKNIKNVDLRKKE